MNAITIFGMQAATGLIAVSAGVAKLLGADIMVDAFDLLGLSSSVRLAAGAVEVLGGLCLLLPRSGFVGALLVAAVVVAAAGLSIGQMAAGARDHKAGVVRTHLAIGRSGEFTFQAPVTAPRRGGIDI